MPFQSGLFKRVRKTLAVHFAFLLQKVLYFILKVQCLAEIEGCGNRQRAGFEFSQANAKSNTEMKLLALINSFVGAELMVEWEDT